MKACLACVEQIPAEARNCPLCGEAVLESAPQASPRSRAVGKRALVVGGIVLLLAGTAAAILLGSPADKAAEMVREETTPEIRSSQCSSVESCAADCESSVEDGCTRLGGLLETGENADWIAAAKAYSVGCANKEGRSCTRRGKMSYLGRGVRHDLDAADQFFEKGCELGAPLACAEAAAKGVNGDGPARERAKSLAEDACSSGIGRGCEILAELDEVRSDTLGKKSMALFEAACSRRELGACSSYATRLLSAKKDDDFARVLKMACSDGDGAACATAALALDAAGGWSWTEHLNACLEGALTSCRHVAVMTLEGASEHLKNGRRAEGGKLVRRALARLESACSRGAWNSCVTRGDLLARGGSEDDYFARANYQLACEMMDFKACARLGYMYRHSRGLDPSGVFDGPLSDSLERIGRQGIDDAKAAELLKEGCALGMMDFGDICAYYGYMVESGVGVEKAPMEAIAIYKDACEEKSPTGCQMLVRIYSNGEVVPKDRSEARHWTKKGKEMVRARKKIGKSLPRFPLDFGEPR